MNSTAKSIVDVKKTEVKQDEKNTPFKPIEQLKTKNADLSDDIPIPAIDENDGISDKTNEFLDSLKKKQNAPSKTRFSRPSQFQEAWHGKSPYDLVPGINRDEIIRIGCKQVLDMTFVIHGFLKLQGQGSRFKDKNGGDRDFAIITCTSPDDTDFKGPFTVSCSGMVVLKKLLKCDEVNGFPMLGKLVFIDDRYFDLIDGDDEYLVD